MIWWVTLAWFIGTSIVSALLAKHPEDAVASSMGDFTAPTAEEGRPISLFFGTCKIQGPNVTWWGALRNEAIKKESGGFLGIGSKSVTVGYRYYLGMQMALCAGPVDAVVDIVVGDKSLGISSAYAPGGTNLVLNNPGLFGGEEKEGGLAGAIGFYYGSPTQSGDAYLGNNFNGMEAGGTRTVHTIMGDLTFTNPPTPIAGVAPGYRGVCHAVLKDFYIGTSTYLKQWAWILRRCPSPAGLNPSYANINGDANPAYMLVDILTLDRELGGLGLSTSRINVASFQSAGQALFAEGFGMSLLCDKAQSADTWMGEICRTVDAVVYTDPATGLWIMKLIRPDYDLDILPEFDDTSILEVPEVNRPSWPETLNKIIIRYVDRAQGFTVRTAQDKDSANRAVVGVNRESTIDYFGISGPALAQKLASRELRGHAYPFASMSLVMNRKAWALRPGSPFKFTWPLLGLNALVCRVSNIRYGDFSDGRITVEAVQDIFSSPASLYVDPPPSGWTNPTAAPVKVAAQLAMEVPYWLIGESRNVMVLATAGDTCHQAEIWTDQGNGYTHTSDLSAFTPSGYLSAAYSAKTLALDAAGFTLESGIGMLRLSSTNTDGLNRGDNLGMFADTGEIFGWTAIINNNDGTFSFTGILRGLLDTVPADHALGTCIFFMTDGSATSLPTDEGGGSGTPGAPGVNGRSYIWHGPWDSTHAYEIDDTCSRNGSSYVAIQPSTNQDPAASPSYWSLMALRGTDGTDGIDGLSTFTRTTVNTTTDSLAPGSVANASLTMKRTANILTISTDYPAWVRIYGTSAQRAADTSRLITEDYAPGSGCFLDASTQAGALTVNCSPVPVFVNGDGTPVDVAYVSIKNLDGSARAITLSVLYLPLEA